MKTLPYLVIIMVILSCGESIDPDERRLVRIEATSYTGYVLHREYLHDRQGRIIKILSHVDDDEPVVTATITYGINEIMIVSYPKEDPRIDQTRSVRLILNADGLTEKRIELRHEVSVDPGTQPPMERFYYDTLVFEYDASGFVATSSRNRYDSTWISSTRNRVRHVSSNCTFKIESDNLISSREYWEYPIIDRDGDSIVYTGGSMEEQTLFSYSKSYPNRTDFKNFIVLSEYKIEHETYTPAFYKHMPDQVKQHNINKDLIGEVFFDHGWTIDIERTYNDEGFLSLLKIPDGTQYREIKYFYR